MPKPVVDPAQIAGKDPAMSDYPDLISDTTVALAMCKAVPDVVDEVTDSAKLKIKWGSLDLENGMQLDASQVLEEPEVEVKGSGTYTLMLVDPDAPTPNNPQHRSMLHMLVINIPSNDVSRGELVEEYFPPDATRGKHRFVWLLFKQSGRVTAKRLKNREGFQVRQWAREHGLAECASGLFFTMQSDEQ